MKRFDKRQTEVIILLLACDKNLSSQDIATALGLSSKTIQREIKLINDNLTTVGIEIISKRSKGFYIHPEDKDKFRNLLFEEKFQTQVIPDMQEGRIEWLLDRFAYLMLENAEIDLATLTEELFVSLTTLKKDLVLVKKQLGKNHLSLEKFSNKGLKISGSEVDIRTFIRERLFKNGEYLSTNFSFSKLGKDTELETNIGIILHKYDVYMSDIGFMNFILHLQILIERDRYVSRDSQVLSKIQIDQSSSEYRCALAVLKYMIKTLEVTLPENEVMNIYIHLTTQKRLQIMTEQQERSDEYRVMINETLAEINQIYHYNFTNDTLLIEGLWVHLFSAIKRLKFQMKIENNLLEEIQMQYPFEMQLAQLLAKKMKQMLLVDIPMAEIGFLALHFCGANERRTLRVNSEKLKVVLVCSTGLGTSILLKSKITAKFSTRIQIQEILSYHDLVKFDFSETDLIISTIVLDEHYPIPWLYVSSIVGDRDIALIETFLQEEEASKITDLLSEQCFITQIKGVTNRFEAISHIGEKLVATGQIDASCLTALLHRERLGTTENGNVVAIPHCMDEDILYPKLAIGILEKPIHWKYQDVQIIVLFFMDTKNKVFLQSVFQDLYAQLSKPKVVENMIRQQDYSYFKKLFTQGE